jgi:uncharacterized membrane protein (DUF485 family)
VLHEPANNSGQIDPAAPYKSRLGLALFGLYATFYAAFVAINLLAPGLMELPLFWGINFAVVYGFVLIIAALILAVIYDALCRAQEAKTPSTSTKDTQAWS